MNKGYDVIEQVLYPARRDINWYSDLDQAVSGLKTGDVITLRLYYAGRTATASFALRIP